MVLLPSVIYYLLPLRFASTPNSLIQQIALGLRAGGRYRLELFLPEQYPMEPPQVRFLSKNYHPNIVRNI